MLYELRLGAYHDLLMACCSAQIALTDRRHLPEE